MDKRQNHIIFWVGYFFYYAIIMFFTWRDIISLYELSLKIVVASSVTIITFYFFVFFLFPQTLPTKKYFLFTLGIFLSLLIVPIFCYFTSVLFSSITVKKISFNEYYSILFRNILSFFRAINFAFLFWFFKVFAEKLKEKQQIEMKSSVLKQVILSSELLGLKNQISPHFFYNSLNFLYSQSLPYSSKLSKTILTLSDMMRYAIREKEDYKIILLEHEIDYLKKYIYLENTCSPNKDKAILEITGNIKYRRITPMTLRTVLDNSFRYGTSNHFHLIIDENRTHFISTYAKKEGIEINDIDISCEIMRKELSDEHGHNLSMNYNSRTQLCKIHLSLVS